MPALFPPKFWSRSGIAPSLLQPLAQAFAAIGAARAAVATAQRAPVPVICVGNLVVGGAGKTPVVESIASLLAARGRRPAILSRGYAGTLRGPMRVDAARNTAREVGDEPLLLARTAPVWIGTDRAASARAAAADGADCAIMDDGFQNTRIAKDLSLLVIDGAYGLGNGRVMPAGPLREPAKRGLARADAVVMLGQDRTGLEPQLAKPVLRATLEPVNGADFASQPVIAFAGIGRPEKFFATLESCGAHLIARHAFPDHHRYTDAELRRLAGKASSTLLVTTEKDWVRLTPDWRARVAALAVRVIWQDETRLLDLLNSVISA